MKIYNIFISILLATCTQLVVAQEPMLDILRDELTLQFKELQSKEYPPYLMSYRVIERNAWNINSSLGALVSSMNFKQVAMTPQVRIGDYEFDNFKNNPIGSDRMSFAVLPIDNAGELAIRQALWGETVNRYNFAVATYKNNKAKSVVNVASEDSAPCYSKSEVIKFYEAPLTTEQLNINTKEWEARVMELSALFKKEPNIIDNDVTLSYEVERRYFIDTEGTEVVHNMPYAKLMISGTIKAADGMELPLMNTYFAYNVGELPSQQQLLLDTKAMLTQLIALRNAPIVDPYTGPALLSGAASGVFFHEIFGHRIEGLRLKSDKDGQTFKRMVGTRVLPPMINVYDNPTLKEYAGSPLNGYYRFDDEGVKAQCVNVVENGVLKDFLMTRTPIDGFMASNGHARGLLTDPVSRQSNLIIETTENKTDAELRHILIEEVKKQGKPFGFFFKSVTGGFTYTDKEATNSFNITPLEVYRVYVDGRPDELVRGVGMIGTPLSMFSNIIDAGGRAEIFTGMCGAESGYVPVTAISPSILVSKIEIQRNAKSEDIPPIIPCPEYR